jgi:hypothetical protein
MAKKLKVLAGLLRCNALKMETVCFSETSAYTSTDILKLTYTLGIRG